MSYSSSGVIRTGLATLFGLIVAVPVAIAVVVTYNLTRQRAWLRYPALAMAVVTSCTLGVGLMFFVESGTSRAYLETESLLDPFLVAYHSLRPVVRSGRRGVRVPARRE